MAGSRPDKFKRRPPDSSRHRPGKYLDVFVRLASPIPQDVGPESIWTFLVAWPPSIPPDVGPKHIRMVCFAWPRRCGDDLANVRLFG
eukprot:6856465-Alexandrium_andersonii.AAC.1